MRDHGDDAYSRARRDPAFLEAVRKAYAGRRDVLNALWWMSHPAEAAPDGTPSPIDQLRDLQHRVFSADGDSAGDPHAILAIRDLEAELSAEREAITAAVQAADAEPDGHRFPSRTPVETAVGSAIPDEPGFAWTAEETVLPAEGRTRNLLVILGIVAALAASFAVGTQVSVGRVDASPPAVAVTAKETCGQLSDVYTILMNARISHDETRTSEQEYQGANLLAARIVRRVDAPADTPLAKRVNALKLLVPYSGETQGEYFDPLSTEWDIASRDVSAACEAAGSAIGLEAWTGG